MHPRSFLHPTHAYRNAEASQKPQHFHFQAPNIFVVPPEEDCSPPWCCFDAARHLGDDDDDDDDSLMGVQYSESSLFTPYLHRSPHGLEYVALPTRRAGSLETRSVVDALGDAHDYSDNESEQEPVDIDLEEDDGIESEMETNFAPSCPRERYYQLGQAEAPHSQQREVGNDSDVIEVIKVRRHTELVDHSNEFGSSGGGNECQTKNSFRSRATRALRSLRGTIRSASKTSIKSKDSTKSLSKSNLSKSKSFSKLRKSKSQYRPRAQDVFDPIEKVPPPERSDTPGLFRRPSSRLSQLFSPALKQHASTTSFTPPSSPTSGAPYPQTDEPEIDSSPSPPLSRHSSVIFRVPSRRSISSTRTRRESMYQDADDVPTPTRNSYQQHSEEDEPTPSWHNSSSKDPISDLRPTSPTPAPRSLSPTPSTSQTTKRFRVPSLHKIFHKSSSNDNSQLPPSPVCSNPDASPANSTCPSLSSTVTSESGCTSPTLDFSPQTPTSLDGIDERRTIVPVASYSTFGGHISLSKSVRNGAVSSSCFSGGETAATITTRTSISSAALSDRESLSTPEPGSSSQADGPILDGSGSAFFAQQPRPRTSIASIPSVVSTNTAGTSRSMSSGTIAGDEPAMKPPFATPRISDLDLNLKLDVELNLGLGINLAPSSSGGLLSSNGMAGPGVKTNHHTRLLPPSKHQGGNTLSRSLSLRNLSSKLGLSGGGKQQSKVPSTLPLPALPDPIEEEANLSLEMRLDSLHFDDLSFDADDFLRR